MNYLDTIEDRGFVSINGKEHLWTLYTNFVELFDGDNLWIFPRSNP